MTEQNVTVDAAVEERMSSSRLLKRPLSPEDSEEEYTNPSAKTKGANPQKRTNRNAVKPMGTKSATRTNKKLKNQGSTSAPQPQQHCQHPKHEIYLKLAKSRLSRKLQAKADEGRSDRLVAVFKRLEGVFDLDSGALMCKRCLRQTDKDPEYTSHPKYVSARSIFKKNERARLVYEMKGIELIDLD